MVSPAASRPASAKTPGSCRCGARAKPAGRKANWRKSRPPGRGYGAGTCPECVRPNRRPSWRAAHGCTMVGMFGRWKRRAAYWSPARLFAPHHDRAAKPNPTPAVSRARSQLQRAGLAKGWSPDPAAVRDMRGLRAGTFHLATTLRARPAPWCAAYVQGFQAPHRRRYGETPTGCSTTTSSR